MLTVHFKNKEEFYEQIADGSLQKIMMEYFNRSADMGLPIEEDTLFYNFEVEFECVLENGKRCITDEKVACLLYTSIVHGLTSTLRHKVLPSSILYHKVVESQQESTRQRQLFHIYFLLRQSSC